VFLARKLVLAHFWVAFVAFLGALVLGAWQMYIRSPLATWVNNPEHYYRSVTAHGTVMAYVLPTLVAMGFGYAITELALKRPLVGVRWAWGGFWLVIAGTVLAAVTMALGKASVLYTFYPPMLASPLYYVGVVLVVVGSWIWVALMSINLRRWKKENPGEAVPLAMFGNVAGAYLWAWTSVGAAVEVLVLILPASLGLTDTINAGLARVLFSVDAARDRLLLADALVHRLLHDRAAGDRRPPLQRHDGPGRVRALPRLLDADRHPSPVRRSPGRAPDSSSCTRR
jgi:cytochrome c oxidase subunit 1